MTNVQLISLLCVVLVVLIILAVLLYKRIKNLSIAYDEVDSFCDSLLDIVYAESMEAVDKFIDSIGPDFATNDLQNIILEAVSNIVDKIKDLIAHELKTYINNDLLSDLAVKIMNKFGYIDDIAESYIEKFEIEKVITDQVEAKLGVRIADIEEQNKEIEAKYNNESEFYNDEECNKDDLVKNEDPDYALKTERTEDGEYVIPEDVKKEMESINPPKDEDDDSFNPETMEVIGEDGLTDEERALGYKIDKNGRKRNKQGRFV